MLYNNNSSNNSNKDKVYHLYRVQQHKTWRLLVWGWQLCHNQLGNYKLHQILIKIRSGNRNSPCHKSARAPFTT